MEVPITERRKEITRLFHRKDYEGLGRLGIRMVEGAGPLDCGYYVLHRLGFHSYRPEVVAEIWKSARSSESHAGIVLYRFKDSGTIQQHGLYDGTKVVSKWGKDEPVFEHDLLDVPTDYGDVAEFVVSDDELKFRLQQATAAQLGGGADYY